MRSWGREEKEFTGYMFSRDPSDEADQEENKKDDRHNGDNESRPVGLGLATLPGHLPYTRQKPHQGKQGNHAQNQFFPGGYRFHCQDSQAL